MKKYLFIRASDGAKIYGDTAASINSGGYRIEPNKERTKVTIYDRLNRDSTDAPDMAISDFLKEDGSPYLTYAELDAVFGAFFFNVKPSPASGSYTRYIVPIEQIDGRLTIEVPNEVDLTKDTIVVEGKFTHTPDVDYTIENVAGKGNFTFTVAPTELTVIRYIKK